MELVTIVINNSLTEKFNLRLMVIGQFKYHLKTNKDLYICTSGYEEMLYVFCEMPARVTQRHYILSLFILLFPQLSGQFLPLRLIKITSVSNPLRMRDGCIS